MDPHGLILSQDGATGCRMFFVGVLAPSDVIFVRFLAEIRSRGSKVRICLYFYIFLLKGER